MKEIRLVKVLALTSKKTGAKFTAYKVVDKNGSLMDCKFTQDVTNKPTKPCTLIVDPEKMNVSTKGLYPCLWIREINSIVENKNESNVDVFF